MSESSLANSARVQKALGDLRKLPLLPATAQQAMALANNDGSNIHEFARVVERDITLASSILKLANSPMFSWGRNIESLDQAVVRMGLRECQNLMMAVSMGNLFKESNPQTKAICAVLWKHCFMTACLCRRLNQELRFGYQGEDFAAGLLHDLGRILLAITMPESYSDADPIDFKEDDEILDRERNVLETDHCQIGFTYGQENRLPFSATAAIRFHHQPNQAKDHRGIISLVGVADHMANYLQRGEKIEAYDLAGNAGYEDMARGWSPEKVAEFKRFVPRLLQETTQVVNEQQAAPRAAPQQKSRPQPKPAAKQEPQSLWSSVKSWW
jgi:HD-like signal output (HDOD) protein